jgi:putative spermidine/putrescine transport system permease protein
MGERGYDRIVRLVAAALAALVFLFLIAPLVVLVTSSFNRAGSMAFPPSGLSLRWYAEVLGSPDWQVSFRLSGLLVLLVVPTTVVIGTLAAYGLTQGSFPGRRLLQGFALSPLMVPEIIVALGLLYYFHGVGLINSVTGLWLAHSLVALPFVVRAVMVSTAQLDPALERAALSLGAGRVRVFLTVTLPLLRPGILAAWLLIFMACVRELGVSVFLMGPNAKVIAPSIVSAFASSGTELTAAMALIQTASVVVALIILFRLTRGMTKELA